MIKKILYSIIGLLISALIYISFLISVPEPSIPNAQVSIEQPKENNNMETDRERDKEKESDGEDRINSDNYEKKQNQNMITRVRENILRGYRLLVGDVDLYVAAEKVVYGRDNPMLYVKKEPPAPKVDSEGNPIDNTNDDIYNSSDPVLAYINNYNSNKFDGLTNGFTNGYNRDIARLESVNINPIIETFKDLFVLPVDKEYYKITSEFGIRIDPITKEKPSVEVMEDFNWRFHEGLDLADVGIDNSNIYAVAPGVVKAQGEDTNGYGNYVVIDHGDFETLYAHLSKQREGLRVNDLVGAGQVIGYIGTTGNSTGPHLHIEFILENEVRVNPEHFFNLILQ